MTSVEESIVIKQTMEHLGYGVVQDRNEILVQELRIYRNFEGEGFKSYRIITQ